MSKAKKIINGALLFGLILLLTVCAPAKKNTYYSKKKESTRVNASQLGRNKYFFSSGYQKKLSKKHKKR